MPFKRSSTTSTVTKVALSFLYEFDVECGSSMVHLSTLVGNQPQFGEPTDLESTLPNLATRPASFGHLISRFMLLMRACM